MDGEVVGGRKLVEERRVAELEELLSHNEFEPVVGRDELWCELTSLVAHPRWTGLRVFDIVASRAVVWSSVGVLS